MKRSIRILLLLTLSGTGEIILGACMRFLELTGANVLMALGLVSQVGALGYAGYISLNKLSNLSPEA